MHGRVTLLLLLLGLVVAALAGPRAAPRAPAPDCDPQQCTLPNCRCFQTGSVPGGFQPSEIAQIVMVTFDDAVSQQLYDQYYEPLLTDRQNPNGCPASFTFFMAHEYTDYSLVNKLYNMGSEIAIHSITHTTTTQYWLDATEQVLEDEYAGERETISHFANIPAQDITGVRTPFLQLAGDTTFTVLERNGLYDCSWPTFSNVGAGLYPYSLDYKSNQDCPVGRCPTESHPGSWVVPMVDWLGYNGVPCNMVDQCLHGVEGVQPLFEFMKTNFERHYNGFREPFGFFVHAAWFITNTTNYEATRQFLDYLNNLPDVYLVSVDQAVKWTKNPTNLAGAGGTFSCPPRDAPCTPTTCVLQKPNEGERWMRQCLTTCPPNYPWLGNPLGQ